MRGAVQTDDLDFPHIHSVGSAGILNIRMRLSAQKLLLQSGIIPYSAADHGAGVVWIVVVTCDRKDRGIGQNLLNTAVHLLEFLWLSLPRYIPEEDTRLMLKNRHKQYQQYSKEPFFL